MNEPIVSFCIATFQRYEILKELILEILSVRSNELEVVVCDDQSLDDSIDKIRNEINDMRLHIYVNKENVGSLLNIHDSLDRGRGNYLFYVNDRDNIDAFKIEKLIKILQQFEMKNIAFAKCIPIDNAREDYYVLQPGKEALVAFACKEDHPTGYIFKKKYWDEIKNKRTLFFEQKYGDYVITQVCAILAKKYKGAWIFGDICNVWLKRIDFITVKSGYYNKRIDKRLYYTPEVLFRELTIGEKFLKKLKIEEEIRKQIFVERYSSYLSTCVTHYKDTVSNPQSTIHYDYYPSQNVISVFIESIKNGMKLWRKSILFCLKNNIDIFTELNKITKKEFINFFTNFFKFDLKNQKTNKEKNYELDRRDANLVTYAKWINKTLYGKKISSYLYDHGYYTVAIYGVGIIGENLFDEILNSPIHINYVIDKKISKTEQYYKNVPCYNMDSKLPYVDLIIVTVSSESREIMIDLRKKVSYQIKSINDILFVM